MTTTPAPSPCDSPVLPAFYERIPPSDREAETCVLGSMLLSPQAITDVTRHVTGPDFYWPAHELIFTTIIRMHHQGTPADPITVGAELTRQGLITRTGGPAYLHTLVNTVPTTANAEYYAEIIREKAARRSGIEEATRAVQALHNPDGDAQEIIEETIERIRAVRDRGLRTDDAPSTTLRTFLSEADDEPAWVIPGTLARWDRLIITAAEGGGKSLFNRQTLLRTAAGLHPWKKTHIPPQQALLIDVENSRSQIRPWLRTILAAATAEGADDTTPDRLTIATFENGLDLHHPADRSRLLRIVERSQPDIIAIGPLYKLASGNPNDEETARVLMSALEAARAASNGAALLIEAHAPHRTPGTPHRDLRPIGSSLWMRWPEFGFALSPAAPQGRSADSLGLTDWLPWRGSRSTREWPEQFMRGTTWPWAAATKIARCV
ncbi:DnaB-like helicase N-terminal domain-containing protein [Streptomyces olivoreticuli]